MDENPNVSMPLTNERLDILAHSHAIGTVIPWCQHVVDDMICEDTDTRSHYINRCLDIEENPRLSKTIKRLKKTLARKETTDLFLSKFIRQRVTSMRGISDSIESLGSKILPGASMSGKEKLAFAYNVHSGARKYATSFGYDYFRKNGRPPWVIENVK